MSLSNLEASGALGGGVNLALPYLRASKASASLVSGGGGYTSFGTFDSVVGSMAGQFSLAGGFTPLVSGIYHITAQYTFNNGAPSAGISLINVAQSGAIICETTIPSYIGGLQSPTTAGLVRLTAGVAVGVGGYQTVASPLNVSNITFTAVLVASD